jgi:hypothetical protein
MNKIKTALFYQSGRSMIEMLGVLAIVGVLSVGGLAGYNMAMHKIRINRVIEELQLITAELNNFNPASAAKISGLDYKKYVDTAPLEKALNVLNAKLGSLASGEVPLYTYYIEFINTPLDLCMELMNKLDDGTNSITTHKIYGTYVASFLLSSTKAQDLCKEAADSENGVSIEFYFGGISNNSKKGQ